MGHAPRGFVGAADLALQFLCGDPMARTCHEVHGEEPVGQGRPALVEDGPSTWVDVVAALLAGKSPALGHGVKLGIDPASRAIQPCSAPLGLHDRRQTSRIIGEVSLELFESVFGHGSTLTCDKGVPFPALAVKG